MRPAPPGGTDPRAAAQALHQQQQLAAHAVASPSPYAPAHAARSPAHHPFAATRLAATASPATTAPHSSPALAANGHPPLPMTAQPPLKPELHTPARAVPAAPASPVAQARAQDRMATLLDINSILIKEVCDLQAQGKAGQVGPSPDGKSDGDKPQPSKEYVE